MNGGKLGIDIPDERGRTGLDGAGRNLDRNPDVVVRDVEVTSVNGWHVLRRTTFDYRWRDGHWTTETRETYDRGNGVGVLAYDLAARTVLLVRQFRYPVYVNDHRDGWFIEVAAGLLDDNDPEAGVRREASEELGVDLHDLTPVLAPYMSPGSITERLWLFAGTFTRHSAGGGLDEEGEDIEVLEIPFSQALAMVRDGRILDAKTIMLIQWAALDGPFWDVR